MWVLLSAGMAYLHLLNIEKFYVRMVVENLVFRWKRYGLKGSLRSTANRRRG